MYMSNELHKGTALKKGKRKYIIQEVLGSGGFGITYKAIASVMDGNATQTHVYAIKEFFEVDICNRSDDGITVFCYEEQTLNHHKNEFIAEAKRLKSLKINGIVKVNEYFEENGTAYYVMEYLRGKTLQNHYADNPCEKNEAVAIIRQIAKTIGELHKQRILHLDIKPSNIIIDEDSKIPTLIDFGAARHFSSPNEVINVQNRTIGYAAPEQTGNITFNPNLDVYAIGTTFYFLLTGKTPSCDSISITKDLPKNLSQTIKETIEQALNRNSQFRTATTDDFLRNLDNEDILSPLTSLQSTCSERVYKIQSYKERNEYSITYKAYITNNSSLGSQKEFDGNQTKREPYKIYEYFEENKHFRNKDNNKIELLPNRTLEYENRFIPDRQINQLHPRYMSNGEVKEEYFEANGTFYHVIKDSYNPTPILATALRFILSALVVFVLFAVGGNLLKQREGADLFDKEEIYKDSLSQRIHFLDEKIDSICHFKLKATSLYKPCSEQRIQLFEQANNIHKEAERTATYLNKSYSHEGLREMEQNEIQLHYIKIIENMKLVPKVRTNYYNAALRIINDSATIDKLNVLIEDLKK